MSTIFHFINDGGLIFTLPILALLIVILIIFIKGYPEKDDYSKTISLISSIAWFTIAWGYLGRTVALIQSFDAIAAAGDISPKIVAPGIKMAIIDPLFGIIVFLLARFGIIILILKQKKIKAE